MTDLGLRLTVDGPVARVVLDRPEVRNAQTPAMWRALAEFGRSLPDEVRVVVRVGGGAVVLGGPRPAADHGRERPGRGAAAQRSGRSRPTRSTGSIAEFQAGFSWLRSPNIISIAAVQGHAVGAGFQLALACDLRVVTPDARFSMREPALGLVPDLGGTQPLVQLVGYSRALEICATTRWVEAAEAKEIGLANIVVPAEELAGTVKDLTDAVLTPLAGAVRETKALLLGAADRTYDEQLKAEGAAQERRLKELLAAFG